MSEVMNQCETGLNQIFLAFLFCALILPMSLTKHSICTYPESLHI